MKFLAIEPFFFDGQYYPADSSAPFAFEYPKGHVPNVRWYPLDKEARAALEDLQKQILEYGTKCIIHNIPQNIRVPPIAVIRAPEKVDPEDAIPPSLRMDFVPQEPTFAMSDVQRQDKGMVPQPKRPSDQEPPKR